MWFKITLFIIQISALGAAIYYWKHYKNTKQKYFLFLILFAAPLDLVSGLISTHLGERFNLLYNLLTIFSILFYLYWFYYLLEKNKIIYALTLIFLVAIIYSLFNYNIVTEFYGTLLTVGTVLIIICSTMYFMSVINTDKVLEFKKSQRFWIVAGLLVFHIGFLPLHLLLPIIKANTLEYKIPMIILNILLYGSYIISFKVAKYKVDE